jgi:mannose-6-phosphate isomerase-like protein (cupin superfamily)
MPFPPGSRSGNTMLGAMGEPTVGEGYALSNIDEMGEGYGFRKIRRALGVTAFGINAIVLPPGYDTGTHYHDEQEETYFVHQGWVAMHFGDGSEHMLGPGGVVRVDAQTHRGMRNAGEEPAVIVIAGGKDGYVGRDGQSVGGNPHEGPPGAA